MAVRICAMTAFFEAPRNVSIFRFCLIHLKKSSICRRCLQIAAMVAAASRFPEGLSRNKTEQLIENRRLVPHGSKPPSWSAFSEPDNKGSSFEPSGFSNLPDTRELHSFRITGLNIFQLLLLCSCRKYLFPL